MLRDGVAGSRLRRAVRGRPAQTSCPASPEAPHPPRFCGTLLSSAVCQVAPPSADTSTRMMPCPPPLHAYPLTAAGKQGGEARSGRMPQIDRKLLAPCTTTSTVRDDSGTGDCWGHPASQPAGQPARGAPVTSSSSMAAPLSGSQMWEVTGMFWMAGAAGGGGRRRCPGGAAAALLQTPLPKPSGCKTGCRLRSARPRRQPHIPLAQPHLTTPHTHGIAPPHRPCPHPTPSPHCASPRWG